jgi:site-specific recombinase XerD
VAERSPKPLGFSETVGAAPRPSRAPKVAPGDTGGRPRRQAPVARLAPTGGGQEPSRSRRAADHVPEPEDRRLEPLVREWLLELKVMGRSGRTIEWYEQKMAWYLKSGQAETLGELTAFELKRYLGELRDRGLADNTIHGFFETLRAFASWADREGYTVEAALLRVRAPKVAQQEVETYSREQLEAIFAATPPGWPLTAVKILLGTGMRLSELCALIVEDFEDDGESAFLKVRRGKGAKFRRVPVSSRLRRELVRYLNRSRPESADPHLLLRADGRPVGFVAVAELFRRVRAKVGFPVRAHRFRHTFATEYLRQGGEIERLRRILGHTTYVMVMRYVHLDKGDLYRDFDLRSPF